MEDKRIRKTKKVLKESFRNLLTKMPFEKITVTEICDLSEVSRITFYAHYENKFDLAEEIFDDILYASEKEYHYLEAVENPLKDPIQSHCNLLDCVLQLYESERKFFLCFIGNQSSYLYQCFYRRVFQRVKELLRTGHLSLKYSLDQTASFLCTGLLSFAEKGMEAGTSVYGVRQEAKVLLSSLLRSNVLMESFAGNS